MVAKDVLLNPEHSFNMVLEQWSSQLACFAYKLQSLQLDMAEFACVNAIMLFEQGVPTIYLFIFIDIYLFSLYLLLLIYFISREQ